MKTLRLAALWTLFLGALAIAPAQTVTVSASHLGGPTPVTGTITFQPVAADGITAISARLGGGGLTTKKPITATVTAGAFTMPNVIDTSLSNPANVCYTVTVRDTTGLQNLGPGFTCVQPALNNSWCTSGVCNFDTFAPAMPSLALTASGPPGATGAAGANGSNGVASLPSLAQLRAKEPLATLANVYNVATNVSGYIGATDGAVHAGGYTSTDFIPANSGGTMTVSAAILSGAGGYAWYDQNQAFVSGSGAGTSAGATLTVPSGAAWFRMSFNNPTSDAALAMVVWGSTLPPSYQAFGTYPSNVVDAHIATAVAASGGASPATITNFTRRIPPAGQNLFNIAALSANTIISSSTGAASGYSGLSSTDYIPVVPGGTVTSSAAIVSGGSGYAFYDSNFTLISASGAGVAGATPITVPAGAYFFRCTFNFGVTPTFAMIVQGSTLPGSYEAFGSYDTATSDARLAAGIASAGASTNSAVYAATQTLTKVLSVSPLNLFDPTAVTLNKGPAITTGVLSSIGGYDSTDYVLVQGQSFITMSFALQEGGGFYGMAFYDANKNWIAGNTAAIGTTVAPGTPIAVPGGAVWMRTILGHTDTTSTCPMVVWGSSLPSGCVLYHQPVPSKVNLSSWYGKTLCAFSDSLFAVPSPNIPAQEALLLGMTLGSIDLHPGMNMQGILDKVNASTNDWSAFSGTGTFTTANSPVTNITSGTTMAAAVSGCDVLQMEIFGNNTDSGTVATGYPYGPNWGNYTDTSSASTLAGWMRANAELLHSLNPTMKIVWVTPYTVPASTGYYPNLNEQTQGQFAAMIAADYGDAVISLVPSGMSPPHGSSAGNYVNGSGASLYGLANNNVHPSNLGASNLLVPYLVQQMKLLGPN